MDRSASVWSILFLPILACTAPAETASTLEDGGSGAAVYVSPTGGETGRGGGTVAGDAGVACTSNAGCTAGQFCQKSSCDSAIGVCAPRPLEGACLGDQLGSTCGCDHLTYANSCWAQVYGENIFATGQCVLPTGGACTSQADCGGASYAAAVYCAATTCGQTAGTCERIPGACEDIMDQVCGCDGKTYYNACFAHLATVGVAYGGPCRSGAIVACNGAADCASGQACVSDSSACTGSAPCTGVCLDVSGESCTSGDDAGTSLTCGGINSPSTQACVAAACAQGTCQACAFTTGASCSADAACPTGQLCIPSTTPPSGGGAAESFCVVP
ncbi:MAG: Kazal-type serine protease inhibitor family protein [Polyangiaceae bacterium]